MNNPVFAFPVLLLLHIACVVLGVGPITGAIMLAVTYKSLGLAD